MEECLMHAKWPTVFVLFFVFLSLSAFYCDAAAQVLRFDPDPFVPEEEQFSVPLLMEAQGTQIKGVEAVVTFDAALVTLDSITPGPWYTGSGQDFFFWDYTAPLTYTLHFASALLDGTSNSDDVIAYCHFSFVDFGLCPLDFTLVDIRDGSNAEIVFGADDGVIFLNPAVDTQDVKFMALKAIYR